MCDHQDRNIVKVCRGARGLGLLQVEHALRCGASRNVHEQAKIPWEEIRRRPKGCGETRG